MREHGQNQEAEQLRSSSLPELLSAVRTPADTDATLEERLESVFAQEAERVANAVVLAELLFPLLSDQLRSSSASQVMIPATIVPPPPPPRPPAPRATSIADFIDEMIAQDSPPERPGTQRRAS